MFICHSDMDSDGTNIDSCYVAYDAGVTRCGIKSFNPDGPSHGRLTQNLALLQHEDLVC